MEFLGYWMVWYRVCGVWGKWVGGVVEIVCMDNL